MYLPGYAALYSKNRYAMFVFGVIQAVARMVVEGRCRDMINPKQRLQIFGKFRTNAFDAKHVSHLPRAPQHRSLCTFRKLGSIFNKDARTKVLLPDDTKCNVAWPHRLPYRKMLFDRHSGPCTHREVSGLVLLAGTYGITGLCTANTGNRSR